MGCYTGCFGYSGTYPAYGPNQVTWPLVYEQSVSVVQQVAYLFGVLNAVHEQQEWVMQNAVTDAVLTARLEEASKAASEALAQAVALLNGEIEQVNASLTASIEQQGRDFEADQQKQTVQITEAYTTALHDLDMTLRALIQQIMDENAAWDVTEGQSNPTKETMRGLFNWVTPDAYSCEQMTEFNVTVDDLINSGLTVQGMATISARAIPRDGWKPKGCYVAQEGN